MTYRINSAVLHLALDNPIEIEAENQAHAELLALEHLRAAGEVFMSSVDAVEMEVADVTAA